MSLRHILLVQNDESAAQAITRAVNECPDAGVVVEWVRSCGAAVERLTRETLSRAAPRGIDAVLLDLFLADSQGIETFDEVFRADPRIPILILSTSENEGLAKIAVLRGAQDYFLQARLDTYLLPKTINSMIERAANAEALYEEQQRAEVTLNSIGDAVISTDVAGRIIYLNAVAESLTGWSRREAEGQPLETVLQMLDAATREVVQNPMAFAMHSNTAVSLTPNCILVRRDGREVAIEDSAAPIHDRRGQVTGAVMVLRDVSAARALSHRMSYLAQHDALTDLPNRVLLKDRLSEAIALACRHGRHLAVLFVDLDRFKRINDSLGHVVGDRLLQSAAQRLVACVRGSDTVSRQGGDEFVIVLSEVAQARDASVTAEKVLQALREPFRVDQHEMRVTGSVGIVTYPDDGTDAEALIKHADFAMYHAKNKGRDNYQFFRSDLNGRAAQRQPLETDLRHALARQELVLHYQPKIDLATGAIIGVEVLIRWHHPERGLMLPGEFIPIAKECGLIVPIGRWALHEACRQSRAWQDAGIAPTYVAINISAAELRAADFSDQVRSILADTRLESRYLEVEVTETILLRDTDAMTAVLRALKNVGVQLALDDFGTAYASVSFHRTFPIDRVKIDQSFVRGIRIHPDDARIVNAVISMGKSLHIRVVAEGFESRQQLGLLMEQGCPEGQGYYFSKPVPADECTRLLQKGLALDYVA
jgi:diguanylate cyclase (GGDEF)-like protein/PAS domain S-box-containing protein